MGLKLGTLLIREGAISPQQLEEALRLQVLYGGRLGTNLIEINALTGDELARWLSQTSGFPPATESALAQAPQDVVNALPADVAERLECFPFAKEGRKLLLAMAKPEDLAAVDAVSFKTGLRIVPHVVPELVLYFHLEKRYGIVRKLRYVRLSSRFEGGPVVPAGIPREAPAPPPLPPLSPSFLMRSQDEIPTPIATPHAQFSFLPTAAAGRYREATSSDPGPPRIQAPSPGALPATPSVPVSGPPPAGSLPQGGSRGAFGWDALSGAPGSIPPAEGIALWTRQTQGELERATTRDELAEALLNFAKPVVGTLLVFVVRDGLALGWNGRGEGLDRSLAERLMLPLNVPSIFQAAVESRAPVHGLVADTDLHKHFYKTLRRSPPAKALVVPVLVKDRAVNLIYADRRGTGDLEFLSQPLAEIASRIPVAYGRLLRESRRSVPPPR